MVPFRLTDRLFNTSLILPVQSSKRIISVEWPTKVDSAFEVFPGSKQYLNEKESNLTKSLTSNSILMHLILEMMLFLCHCLKT